MLLHGHFDVFGFAFARNAKVIAVSIGINREAVNAICHKSLLAEELGTILSSAPLYEKARLYFLKTHLN